MAHKGKWQSSHTKNGMEGRMHRRFVLPVIALLVFATLLTACGGSTATDTPTDAPATEAPTTEPTTAAPPTVVASAATAATLPAGSVATSSSVAPTTAPTAAPGSLAVSTVTRPASSATTGLTTAVPSVSAVTGTQPGGAATPGSVIAGTTTAGSAAAGTSLTLFTDPQGRFSFSRPAAWTVGGSTSPGSVVAYTTTNPTGYLDISTEAYPGATTPATILTAAFAEIKKGIPDAQQVGTTTLQLDSEPAVQIDYTGTVNGAITIYFSQIFALHKGTLYILTLGAQLADIEKMKQQAIPVVTTWKFLQ